MADDTTIELSDFGAIAMSIKPILALHEVPEEHHYSIVSDVIFEFANFLDTKTGSNFHEGVYPLLDDYVEKLSQPVPMRDYLVASIKMNFGKRSFEANILKSQLGNKEHLMFDLEVDLGVRGLPEIDDVIDADKRFSALKTKLGGIESIDFTSAQDTGDENWLSVPLSGSEYGDFEENLSGLADCIRKVARQWL